MASPDMRKLLLRVQTDADFYHLLLVDPEQALIGYSISPTEREILFRRDRSIYQLLLPPDIHSASLEEHPDEKPDTVLPPFPEITLPPLHPIELPPGGGLTVSLPPMTLTLGQPPPTPPSPPIPNLFLPSHTINIPPIPTIFFSPLEAEETDAPESLLSTIHQSSGEARAQAIMQLLKRLDRRSQ